MWHKPQLMTVVADLLLLATAAAAVAVGLVWLSRLPAFPLRTVEFTAPPQAVTRADLERALAGTLDPRFFAVNVEHVRAGLEKLPWVRRATIRRVWPGKLVISLEEQQPVARWGSGTAQLVNGYGEVFYAVGGEGLPVLSGPDETAPEVLARYREATAVLAALGQVPVEVSLSSRLAWRVRTARGLVIELGRDHARLSVTARLARFVDSVKRLPVPLAAVRVADMRYPNGFALRLAGVSAQPSRGNP